ncbi:MAG: Immune-responsive protein 1, partial [uncultured Acetobacteraceae bacterium]
GRRHRPTRLLLRFARLFGAAGGGAGAHPLPRARPRRQHPARPARRRKHPCPFGRRARLGPRRRQRRRAWRLRPLHPGRRRAAQRRPRPQPRLRRHPRRRHLAPRRAGDPGGAGGGGDGRRQRSHGAVRHRRRLRGDLPPRPRPPRRRPLRPRLPPDRHLRRLRGRGRRGARVRPARRGGGGRLRHRPQPIGRQPAIPRQRRLDQALPGRLERHGRPVRRRPGAGGLPRRGRGLRRQGRLPPRLRAEPGAGARAPGPRHRLGTDEHRGEALPLLPLRPRLRGRGDRAARRTRARAGGDRARHHGPAEQRDAAGGRPARLQAEPAERGGRPIQRSLRRRLRPRHRQHGLGQLRPADRPDGARPAAAHRMRGRPGDPGPVPGLHGRQADGPRARRGIRPDDQGGQGRAGQLPLRSGTARQVPRLGRRGAGRRPRRAPRRRGDRTRPRAGRQRPHAPRRADGGGAARRGV